MHTILNGSHTNLTVCQMHNPFKQMYTSISLFVFLVQSCRFQISARAAACVAPGLTREIWQQRLYPKTIFKWTRQCTQTQWGRLRLTQAAIRVTWKLLHKQQSRRSQQLQHRAM